MHNENLVKSTFTSLLIKGSIALSFALASGFAVAWGSIGHKTIAYIAQDELTPQAKKQVMELLALENKKNMADVAMWADKYRKQYPELPDHMVRIPLDKNAYDAQRDCPPSQKLCVVQGVEQQLALLREKKLPPSKRLQALKMVVHFFGDIHQPLHTSAKTGVSAILNGQHLTMHHIWDTESVAQFGLEPRQLANQLETNLPNVAQETPEIWVNEGHEIARRYFKPLLDRMPKGRPIILPDDYLQTIAPVVQLRLQQAGIRLGRALNEIFDQ